MSDMQIQEQNKLYQPGDHDKMAHIVIPKSAVTEAYITGAVVQALCGHRFVPTRDPEAFSVCETCKEVLAELKNH